ncbi:ribosome-associated translation inhibitor RaiA [Candidatus Falkowbacteria bacterium]|jgi:putative sigma-54 modulation protein|nr:ribosome-associated translation inhibitor RaiA [Patescibacteria group bacterium]MDD3434972.1 ribosome-associated translation inhibitor RaiA [Patescibacteria group bacterium]MDD4466342.1 ribosome-associated translation inhibitor RaiA [Patescibacteria group bacterium]NCU42919.1 ribosome-associated translation inhibitor RaiA [Candidatus Falkowbacteria bacterium]
MKINLLATKITLTPAISQYVEEKMNMLEKFLGDTPVIHFDVELAKTGGDQAKGQVFRVEANLNLPGALLRIEKTETDMYKAIDKVKDHLAAAIVKHREKKRDKKA